VIHHHTGCPNAIWRTDLTKLFDVRCCDSSRKSLGVLVFEKQVIFSKNIIVPKWVLTTQPKTKPVGGQ